MKSEQEGRRVRPKVSYRLATEDEANRIGYALDALIARLVQPELDPHLRRDSEHTLKEEKHDVPVK